MSFRLAVLSDLHIDCEADDESWELAKEAFAAVARQKPDHVVIAGDLFDCASAMRRDRQHVERRLRRLGLWHRDRLSIVIGNHDILHTPHRGSKLHRAAELLLVASHDAQDSYAAFCDWAADLVPKEARYWSNDLFPFCKDLGNVGILAADTTGSDTNHSANGYWRKDDDVAARKLVTGERRVLAIHHPPERDEERTVIGQLTEGFAFGFPDRHFDRLEKFADDVGLDAVVCGHVHDNGGSPRSWRLGRRTKVWMMGRTGAMHGAKPCFGLLDIPRRGPLRWSAVRFTP